MDSSKVDRSILQRKLEEDITGFRSKCKPKELLIRSLAIKSQLVALNKKAVVSNIGSLPVEAYSRFLGVQSRIKDLEYPTDILGHARDFIHMSLPPVEHHMEEIYDLCLFGPGSVYHAKTPEDKSLLFKIGKSQSCAINSRELLVGLLESIPNWRDLDLTVNYVRGNRITHVPKDVTKCRQIAVEPSLNVLLQKGIGKFLEKILCNKGISNLSTGQAYHAKLVKDNWREIGTIDLSDASDSISEALVKSLLPSDWFELLNAARSKVSLFRGKWERHPLFTSQGNAFTFPLETLIFYALARATIYCRTGDTAAVSVYGDDIIVPRQYAHLINDAFPSFGFLVNTEKSFWGQHHDIRKFFRESCGTDTLFGVNVRPIYYKEECDHPWMVISLLNRLTERWGFLPNVSEYLLSLIPPKHQLMGPRWFITSEGYGPNRIGSSSSDYIWPESLGLIPDLVEGYFLSYSVRSKKIPRHKLKSVSERARVLAFLYAGSTGYDNIPIVSVRKVKRYITPTYLPDRGVGSLSPL